MEVHKHPHHVTHKKKWGEYLLEFFMLFLAVFLGFVAENIRENNVEHERGKQYMETLIQDVRLDIGNIEKGIDFRATIEKRVDSLFYFFQKPNRHDYLNDIYFLSRRTTRASDLVYHDGTIQQLKNSGGLRLIRNKNVSNDIMQYDELVRNLLNQQQSENEILYKIRDRVGNVFNVFVYYIMDIYDGDSLIIKKPEGNPPLLTDKPEVINDLLNQERYLRGHYIVTRSLQRKLVAVGNNLIALIKKEYHLENK